MRARLTDKKLGTPLRKTAKAELKRELDGAPEYDKTKLAHVVKSLTHLKSATTSIKTALEEFTKGPSDEISPDGKLGGRGYVKSVQEVKESLANAFTSLTGLMDTFADELNNPNWGLSKEEKDQILTFQEKSVEDTEGLHEGIDADVAKLFGSDEETGLAEEPPEGELSEGEAGGSSLEDEEDDFPAFDDILKGLGEEPSEEEAPSEEPSVEGEIPAEEPSEPPTEPALKEASIFNNQFVGFSGNESKLARALAKPVLTNLVKMASIASQGSK